jgi:23S rRNA (uracil1939-C5)-methyltransferase
MTPDLSENEIIEGEIQTIAFGGEGILRHKGFVVFVPFTAIGDIVSCRISEIKKSFAKATLVKVLKAGPHRIKPHCPYFGVCGGCQLQHLDDTGQLNYKLQAVKDALLRIGHLHTTPATFVPAESKWAYRRHITLHLRSVNEQFEAGYIGQDNHTLIAIKSCPIFNTPDTPVIERLQAIVGQIPNPSKKEGRLTILKNGHDRYILSFVFDAGFEIDKQFFKDILQHDPLFTGIIYGNHGGKSFIVGDPYTEINLEGLHFRITPQTFIQNHPEQSANIYRHICKIAGDQARKKIFDLYCGFGMMSLLLAKLKHMVAGVEYNEEAIRFAKDNAQINKLHAQFLQGDVNRLFPRLAKETRPDLVLVNPPRTGLEKNVIQSLLRAEPKEIVYVSCMPSTLARDLALLCNEKYKIQECTVYDMFPQTAHTETLIHLKAI